MFTPDEIFHDMTAAFLDPVQANTGDTIEIRLRTGADVVSAEFIRCETETAEDGQDERIYIRRSMERDPGGENGFVMWRVRTVLGESDLEYFFELRSPTQTVIYDRDGAAEDIKPEALFRFIPGFFTPEWAEGCVMYQIFVDRFRNGDTSNDVLSDEYSYNNAPVIRVKDWEQLPSADGGDIREFYGGDLQGVMDKLDYLQDLGIEAIYLNPVFCSPSTHKYDTQDYFHIDPHFGRIVTDRGNLLPRGASDNTKASRYISRVSSPENQDASDALFALLVQKAHEHGIKVIIDGVFNHCGSFNKWMDRERIYEGRPGYENGAYISEDSVYRNYFTFTREAWPYNSYYEGWWGYDTLPKLNYEGSERLEQEILAIAAKWVSPPYCADGWRLDVAADLGHSPEYNHSFWRKFRKAVKEANPDAVIIAEHYGDAKSWLSGGEWDSVMNYDAFMDPVSRFFTGMEKHSDDYDPSAVGDVGRFWESIRGCAARSFTQRTYSMAMNELSNHDHSRFLTRTNHKVGRSSALGCAAASEDISKPVFREAVLMQMTWPGAPTVYYGDEAGLCGFTDPDNRRTYPWDREDQGLLAFHKDAIRIHRENEELRKGSLLKLDAEPGVLAYGRFLPDQASVILINRNEYSVTYDYNVHVLGIPDNAVVRQLIMTGGAGYHTSAEEKYVKNGILTVTLPRNTAVVYKYAKGMERDEENFRAHSRFLRFE